MTNDQMSRDFPSHVDALRVRLGWSHQRLAAAMCMTPVQLSAFLSGAVPLDAAALVYLLNAVPSQDASRFLVSLEEGRP